MNPDARTLKNIAAQVCKRQGYPLRKLLEDGLEEVLELASTGAMDAQQIACAFIWRCCCTDGKWNNCQAAFVAAMLFVNEHAKVSNQAWADLAAILQGGTSEAQIQQWAKSHF